MEKTIITLKVTEESREAYQRWADASKLSRNLWICASLDMAAGSVHLPDGFRFAKPSKGRTQRTDTVSRSEMISYKAPEKSVDRWWKAAQRSNMTMREWMRVVLDHAAGVAALSQQLERVQTA